MLPENARDTWDLRFVNNILCTANNRLFSLKYWKAAHFAAAIVFNYTAMLSCIEKNMHNFSASNHIRFVESYFMNHRASHNPNYNILHCKSSNVKLTFHYAKCHTWMHVSESKILQIKPSIHPESLSIFYAFHVNNENGIKSPYVATLAKIFLIA